MTPTDEQIAEALADFNRERLHTHGVPVWVTIIAFALRAAQERIKRVEAKTVPMELIKRLQYQGIHTRDWIVKLFNDYGYTVTESAKEEGR